MYRTTAVLLKRLSLEGMPISQSQPTETILVVDDEPEVLALVADHLQTKGYMLLLTGDPREALRLARTRTEAIQPVSTIPEISYPDMSLRDGSSRFVRR